MDNGYVAGIFIEIFECIFTMMFINITIFHLKHSKINYQSRNNKANKQVHSLACISIKQKCSRFDFSYNVTGKTRNIIGENIMFLSLIGGIQKCRVYFVTVRTITYGSRNDLSFALSIAEFKKEIENTINTKTSENCASRTTEQGGSNHVCIRATDKTEDKGNKLSRRGEHSLRIFRNF